MREWLERVRQWFARHKKTPDLFPALVGAVYHAWHDYLWGWTPVAPIIVWWMLGATANVDRAAALIWVFLIVSYYGRRERAPQKYIAAI